MALISVVIPVYNEQDCLETLMGRLLAMQSACGETFEFLFVDDGSSDSSRDILGRLSDSHQNVRTIFLSRNFGHEAATTAGIDHAGGDAVILIDSDLQDPPEVIPELIAAAQQEIAIFNSGTAPTAAQQADIDTALAAAHAALQAAQPGA